MRIDCYGNRIGTKKYLNDTSTKPSEVRKTGNDTYLKYTAYNPCPIHKVIHIGPEEGDYDIRWTYGDWNNREKLKYPLNLSETYDVESYFELPDYGEISLNLEKIAKSRLMWQFRNSPVINQIIEQATKEIQSVSDDILDVIWYRCVPTAEGVNLDTLGNLVGQPRQFLKGFDDEDFRKFIYGKIFKNHSLGGSNPENRKFVSFITSSNCSFVKRGLQYYRLAFPYGIDTKLIKILKNEWRNNQIASFYMLPIPPTVRFDVNIVYIIPSEGDEKRGFGPDSVEMRPDYAKAAIGANIL